MSSIADATQNSTSQLRSTAGLRSAVGQAGKAFASRVRSIANRGSLLRRLILALMALLGGMAVAGWFSPIEILNGIAKFGDYSLKQNIPYASGSRHGLDVYQPAGAVTKRPVAVFFYGGSWEEGNKDDYRFVGAALANRGIVTIIPDYRVYPQVVFPAFLKDGAQAVRWAREHAAEFGGDPDRIVLVGHSAGAHIAAMLALDKQWLNDVGLDYRHDIKGMVGLAGPYDFLPLKSQTLKKIFGPEAERARTQPINFVDGRAAPVFLAAGRNDTTVDPGNSSRLAARIEERGGRATVKFYNGVDHRTIIGAFAAPLRLLAPSLPDSVAFINSVTDSPAAKP